MAIKNKPYWLDVPVYQGSTDVLPKAASIVVIGSGLAGASTAYFLQKQGFENILVVDHNVESSATFRNCGHILHGTVESMKAFSEIHGKEKARELWKFSIELCAQVEKTINELDLKADYRRDGYLVISIDQSEDLECRQSVELLNSMGFESTYVSADDVAKMGFKNSYGARHERDSAQGHPTKFRNGVMKAFVDRGGHYHSDAQVTALEDIGTGVLVKTNRGTISCDAAVIAANAYSPLFSEFFNSRRLIEPFRGQIITSKPLKHQFKVRYPHSFDHGYEYALVTEDNRLMIGGWRNNSPTKEIGTYDLTPNPQITEGLQNFVKDHYAISEPIEWEYVWTGIMGASQTSLPFIGGTNSDRVYAVAGCTGHGFSWFHGSGELLSRIMAGADVPEVARHFNPKHRL